jgi:hypothetical protein
MDDILAALHFGISSSMISVRDGSVLSLLTFGKPRSEIVWRTSSIMVEQSTHAQALSTEENMSANGNNLST